MTRRHQQIIFIIHPPWCKPSRGSLWFFTPTIKIAKIVKKIKFPKLTRNTASVSNHSLLGVWWKLLIPASTKHHRDIITKNKIIEKKKQHISFKKKKAAYSKTHRLISYQLRVNAIRNSVLFLSSLKSSDKL